VVSHLDDPGARRTLRTIEDRALSLNEYEEVLDEIFCLSWISEDTDCNSSDNLLVSLKQAT
jgi:hypothetical protein